MSPTSAILLSLFVPGAAHFRLGQTARGVVAFASCMVLLAVGYLILGDRWHFYVLMTNDFVSWASVFSMLGLNHVPDLGNFGANLALGFTGPGESDYITQRVVRTALESRALENFGRWCTGASGMLGFLWAADAFYLTRGREARVAPGVAGAASWLVPGLGHILLGQKGKGIALFVSVFALFVTGYLASSGKAVNCVESDVWWIGQNGFGGGTLLFGLLSQSAPTADGLELGVNLTTVAGLANLAVILDAWSTAAGDMQPHGSGEQLEETA